MPLVSTQALLFYVTRAERKRVIQRARTVKLSLSEFLRRCVFGEPIQRSSNSYTWKDIPGYEGIYQISRQGQLRSLARTAHGGIRRRAMPLAISYTDRDYAVVALNKKGRRRMYYVHQLVLRTFIGPRPRNQEACHNNGQRRDNRLCNLRWDTHTANCADRERHKRRR